MLDLKEVGVCIAAYNEERTMGPIVKGLVDLGLGNVIVVDDGSKDQTALEARKCGATVLTLPKNAGQWVALRNAFAIALRMGSNVIVTFDADGQHVPRTIPELVRPVVFGTADISVASRFRQARFNGKYVRKLGITSLNLFMWLTTRYRFTDCTSGLTAIRASLLRRILPRLTEAQFGRLEFWIVITSESPRIVEVQIPVRSNPFSKKGQLRFAAHLVRTVVRTKLNTGKGGRQVVAAPFRRQEIKHDSFNQCLAGFPPPKFDP